MGLFGDKDLRKLDTEVTGVCVSVKMATSGVMPVERVESVVNDSAHEIIELVRRLDAKGKRGETDAKLAKLTSTDPVEEEMLSRVRAAIDSQVGAR